MFFVFIYPVKECVTSRECAIVVGNQCSNLCIQFCAKPTINTLYTTCVGNVFLVTIYFYPKLVTVVVTQVPSATQIQPPSSSYHLGRLNPKSSLQTQ